MSLIHKFSHAISLDSQRGFTNPFRYIPHPLVREAAGIVMEHLDGLISSGRLPEEVCRGFSEGKMLGVLVCEPDIYLAAFSGTVGGQSVIEGFVPPIFDLTDPDGYYKEQEAKITDLNELIMELQNASELRDYKKMLWTAKAQMDAELMDMRERMEASKKDRALRRAEGCDHEILDKESQFEKAEFKRLKRAHEDKLQDINDNILSFINIIDEHKRLRASLSDALQEWIFKQYRVMNGLGKESSILDIFAAEGLIPPGGAGDCAAPKLLDHAFRHGLTPVAMGEFWYGKSPSTAVRTAGHFYPSCTSKCGPLLKYMLQGLTVSEYAGPSSADGNFPTPEVLYEDEAIIAIDKPSGMPSVPGLDGKESAQEWAGRNCQGGQGGVRAVHRLDMDTSGILLIAKTRETYVNLQRQFEERLVRKTYMARLSAGDRELKVGDKGRIELPLSPDYDERPRQKVDFIQGKEAVTDYEVVSVNKDGTADVLFHPVTGRTHQLRLHAAHHLGLGRPIVGDLLYGAHTLDTSSRAFERLCLHAAQISFTHPVSGREMEIEALRVIHLNQSFKNTKSA